MGTKLDRFLNDSSLKIKQMSVFTTVSPSKFSQHPSRLLLINSTRLGGEKREKQGTNFESKLTRRSFGHGDVVFGRGAPEAEVGRPEARVRVGGGGRALLLHHAVARVAVAAVHLRGGRRRQRQRHVQRRRRRLRQQRVVRRAGVVVGVRRRRRMRLLLLLLLLLLEEHGAAEQRLTSVARPLRVEQVLRHVPNLVRQHVLLHVALQKELPVLRSNRRGLSAGEGSVRGV